MSEEGTTEGAAAALAAEQTSEPGKWYEGESTGLLEEDVGFIQNKQWDTPKKMVDSYRELEKYKGDPSKMIKIPDDPQDEKALRDIHTKLGCPETPEGYKLTQPEGVEVHEGLMKGFLETAHKAGATQKQAQMFSDFWNEFNAAAQGEHNQSLKNKQEAELVQLKTEWTGAYEEREHLGRQAYNTFGKEAGWDVEDLKAVEEAVGTAKLMKMFYAAGKGLGEDKFIEGDLSSGNRGFGTTKAQMMDEMKQLKEDISGDPQRLNLFVQGKGSDYEKMKNLEKMIAGG